MHAQLQKPSNYTSILVTCSTSREPLKTSKIDRIQQSPWRPATLFSVYLCYSLYLRNRKALIFTSIASGPPSPYQTVLQLTWQLGNQPGVDCRPASNYRPQQSQLCRLYYLTLYRGRNASCFQITIKQIALEPLCSRIAPISRVKASARLAHLITRDPHFRLIHSFNPQSINSFIDYSKPCLLTSQLVAQITIQLTKSLQIRL